jgi:hypothetical protein
MVTGPNILWSHQRKMPLNNVQPEHEWNIFIRATVTRIFVTRPLKLQNAKTSKLSDIERKLHAYRLHTRKYVGLQNVTEIKGVRVTCCLISNRMTQTMRTHKNADLLLQQSNLNATIVHCYNECLIHVSQDRYRLTMHTHTKKKRSDIYYTLRRGWIYT